MLKKIYLSPLGYIISFIQNIFAILHQPFMVYGYYNRMQKKFMKYTRISSSVAINSKEKLDIDDNVWIWHNTILDATNIIKISRGCQIGANVGIFTHSSHIAIRLLGENYINLNSDQRIGYINQAVSIGDYTFIASNVIILPGVTIGKGCLITSGSVVMNSIPDACIASGNPAKTVGGTELLDRAYFSDSVVVDNYYNKDIMLKWQEKQTKRKKNDK